LTQVWLFLGLPAVRELLKNMVQKVRYVNNYYNSNSKPTPLEFPIGNPKAKESGRQAEYDRFLMLYFLHLFCSFQLSMMDSANSRPVRCVMLKLVFCTYCFEFTINFDFIFHSDFRPSRLTHDYG
jgi:hypothetical protein